MFLDFDAPHAARKTKPPTIVDVARHANVSRQTISRVVNGLGGTSPTTRQRVLEAINELGYRPNALARSLKTNASRVIGLVMPDISRPFYPRVARGAEDAASAAGYSVFVCNVSFSAEREIAVIARLRELQVAGAIVYNPRLDEATLGEATGNAFPVVQVNREPRSARGKLIWPGYRSGAELAARHLLSLGRRRVAYLGLDYDSPLDRVKFEGYRAALEAAGLDPEPGLIGRAASTVHGGYVAMTRLRADADAVFASNDLMAVGALRHAVSCGARVPDDLAIVGFGGLDLAALVTPALSTVRVPYYTIGRVAVHELFRLINHDVPSPRPAEPEPVLLLRGSTVAGADAHLPADPFDDDDRSDGEPRE